MLAVKIKRLKISKSYFPNNNFVQFPWPAIPSTVHLSQIIVHLIMNPLKSTGTCVHVLIVSLPGFSVGNTAGENPGYSPLEKSNSRSLDSECKSSESVTLGVSIHIRKTAIKYSRDLYQHTKTYQTTLRVRHLLTVVAFLRLCAL